MNTAQESITALRLAIFKSPDDSGECVQNVARLEDNNQAYDHIKIEVERDGAKLVRALYRVRHPLV